MNNIPLDKKIGIWGFGATGKSAVNYFHPRCYHIDVFDEKKITEDDQEFLKARNISFFNHKSVYDFLEGNDYILPSPGIDLAPYTQYAHKFLNELDLFYASWNKPIIAITGSIGKTTITHLLSLLLKDVGLAVATGGNIGTPMLDLLALKNSHDTALLELSSFQLEHCKKFAPDLAIVTNLYPNHLDRHGSEESYLRAKANICAYQNNEQVILLPLALKDTLSTMIPSLKTKKHGYYFSEQIPVYSVDAKLYSIQKDIIKLLSDTTRGIAHVSKFPPITFVQNWLIIQAVFDILKLPMPNLDSVELHVPEHRLEKVATINGVDFYNDSKSTTTQSTVAALERLNGKPILLFLGGLSKGVDRTPFITDIKDKVKKIYCFGKEAHQLAEMCQKNNIAHRLCQTLEDAFCSSIIDMKSGDQIVLSPAGSSYDLYTNYIERGNHFKKMVSAYNADNRLTTQEQ